MERVTKAGGQIATAHAAADRGQLRVSEVARKQVSANRRSARISMFGVDARGDTTATVATEYFPRPIPRQTPRRGMAYAHYSTQLPLPSHAGSAVRVVFHGTAITQCEFKAGS